MRWLFFLVTWSAMLLRSAAGADDGVDFLYRLAPGDSIWSISQTLLAQPKDWHRLQRYNHVGRDRRLPPGTIIRIPYAWLKRVDVLVDVERVHGEATWTDPANTAVATLKAGMKLRNATRIRTGAAGHVTLRLADGSVLQIAPASDVQLHAAQYAGTSVTHVRFILERGRVETQAAPLRQPASVYEIRTPTAQLGVRGTRFRVALAQDRGSSTAEVVEGAVAASNPALAPGVPIALGAGFGTVVRAGQAPLPPIALLPAPDLAHLTAHDLGAAISVAFEPVKDAKAYRVQVARDAQFLGILFETLGADARIRLANLGEGDFHVRVRAIDANGLEGREGRVALRLTDIQL